MSVFAMLWEHAGFGGFHHAMNSADYRYYGWFYGSANDKFSSMRAWSAGHRGNVYAFEHTGYVGRFALLNVNGGDSSSWFHYFGSGFNDVVSSALIIRREPKEREIEVPLKANLVSRFETIFMELFRSTVNDFKRRPLPPKIIVDGGARFFTNLFPQHDAKNVSVRVERDLVVTLDSPLGYRFWYDYQATIKVDVRFGVQNGRVSAAVTWFEVKVESGEFSQPIADDLARYFSPIITTFAASINASLANFAMVPALDAYLLPGHAPNMNTAGGWGNYSDDAILIIVK